MGREAGTKPRDRRSAERRQCLVALGLGCSLFALIPLCFVALAVLVPERPCGGEPIPFDAARWQGADECTRVRMAFDLAGNGRLEGADVDELFELLGEGRRSNRRLAYLVDREDARGTRLEFHAWEERSDACWTSRWKSCSRLFVDGEPVRSQRWDDAPVEEAGPEPLVFPEPAEWEAWDHARRTDFLVRVARALDPSLGDVLYDWPSPDREWAYTLTYELRPSTEAGLEVQVVGETIHELVVHDPAREVFD